MGTAEWFALAPLAAVAYLVIAGAVSVPLMREMEKSGEEPVAVVGAVFWPIALLAFACIKAVRAGQRLARPRPGLPPARVVKDEEGGR